MNGVLVLDKPSNMSSASAVDHVKKRLAIKRAGHGGTLDPIATGVLAVCLGEATKLASFMLADDKEYEAELVLGVETDTLDRTGAVTATHDASAITRDAIAAALATHLGEHDQVPPMYSAIKLDGVRMYTRARAGEQIAREPRRIRIDRLELLDFQPPRARIAIACGKGTYVRSLIDDLGHDLGCGAHLAELRRTRSGAFTIAQAVGLDYLGLAVIVPMTAATSLPIVTTPAALVAKVLSGVQTVPELVALALGKTAQFQFVDEAGSLLAVVHLDHDRIIYDRVFPA